MKRLPRFLAITLATIAATRGFSADPLHDTEVRQQQIRLNTRQINDQINSLIADFESNALTGGQELKTLQSIRDSLSNLTDTEMDAVITLLQTARTSPDPSTAQRNTVSAFTTQKQIVAALRRLLILHQHQQALNELARLFRDLSTRQDANLRETAALARLTGAKPPAELSEAQRSALDLQRIEQQALQPEARELLAALAKLASESDDDRPRRALKQTKDNPLDASFDNALADLANARLLSATGHQQTIRDQFRAVEHILTLPDDTLSQLRQAGRDLDAIEHEQRALLDRTRDLLKQPSTTTAESRAKLADLQTENATRADQLRQDLNHLLPTAADQLQNATAQMRDAGTALTSDQPQRADLNQQAALDSLQQARQPLTQAEQQPQDAPPAGTLDALQNAEQKLASLRTRQDQLTRDTTAATATRNAAALQTAAAAQHALQQQTQQLRQQTAPVSPQATDALGEAARQMEKAAGTMAQPQPSAPTAAAQQAAAAALARAAESLKTDHAAAVQSAAQAGEQLQQAQAAAAQAQQQLARGETSQAGQSLQDAGTALHNAMANADALPKAAAQPIQNAQQAITEAASHAGENQPGEAAASTSQAQAAMSQAQAAMSGAPPTGTAPQPGTAAKNRGTGEGNWSDGSATGKRVEVKKEGGAFIGLPARDRAAIQQSQSEKYPAEYGPLIEQYMKNLADQTGEKK